MNIEVIVLLLAFFVVFPGWHVFRNTKVKETFFFFPLVDLKQIFLSEGVVQSEL